MIGKTLGPHQIAQLAKGGLRNLADEIQVEAS
jgi:hypothetical protein